MHIEWNKVTWYSKLLALALFVALPFIGFYYGTKYGKAVAPINNNANTGQTSAGTDYYRNVAAWQTHADNQGAFSIAYPLDFQVDVAGSMMIPSAFEPQTNFVDAKLAIRHDGSASALADCLSDTPNGGPAAGTSSVMMNRTRFVVFHLADAGAGNFYETTSYRTIHAGQCFAVEYTIHSTQIANYPAEYQLKPFDRAKLLDVLDRIVGTFKFL